MLPLELLVDFWVNKISESFSILLAYRSNYCNAQQTSMKCREELIQVIKLYY